MQQLETQSHQVCARKNTAPLKNTISKNKSVKHIGQILFCDFGLKSCLLQYPKENNVAWWRCRLAVLIVYVEAWAKIFRNHLGNVQNSCLDSSCVLHAIGCLKAETRQFPQLIGQRSLICRLDGAEKYMLIRKQRVLVEEL